MSPPRLNPYKCKHPRLPPILKWRGSDEIPYRCIVCGNQIKKGELEDKRIAQDGRPDTTSIGEGMRRTSNTTVSSFPHKICSRTISDMHVTDILDYVLRRSVNGHE